MGIKLRASPRFRYYYNGAPAAGYTLYAYEPGGGLVPKAFYTDYTGGTAKTSVVLDANGEADIWWDGIYNVIIKNTSGVTVLDTDYYGEGEAVEFTDGFNYSYNGSFEIDTDGDGIPDDWTVSTYTGGTQTLDSDSYHGSVALKFTSTGNGGGIATNTKHPINEASDLVGKFTLKASAASMRLVVDLVWYSVAGAELSTTNLYDDTATNPSTYTTTLFKETPPANTRFVAFRIYGGHSSSATAGSCWFDDFVLYPRNVFDADLEINSLDVGDYGTESAGTNINGTVYTSGFRYSDINDTHLAGVLLHRHSTTQPTVLIGSRSNSTGSSHGAVTNGMAVFTQYGAAWTGSHYDLFGSISFGASSSGTISATSSPGKLEFSVTPDGSNIPGIALTIDQDKSATFAAGISATTGTFSGAVSGTTGTFSGAVSGTTGTFSGAVSASSYGAVNGTTGTFSGDISAPGIDLTGITDGYLLRLGTGAVEASNIYQDANGNIGLGTTNIDNWSTYPALQIGDSGSIYGDTGQNNIACNTYYTSPNWYYQNTNYANLYKQANGAHIFKVAPSGTADTAITWTTALIINNDRSMSPMTVTGFTGSVANYIDDDGDSQGNNTFTAHSVIGAAWESVGPTGSGATNIWTALDAMPSSAKAIELFVYNEADNTTGASAYQILYTRRNGASSSIGYGTLFSHNQNNAVGATGMYSMTTDSKKVPITNGKFDMYRVSGGDSFTCILTLTGFYN